MKTANQARGNDTDVVSGPRLCPPPASTTTTTPGPDYSVSSLTSSLTAPHNIRLEGGSFPHEGNIMVNGRPVCDDDWGLVDADVACKQLGYSGAETFTKESRYGPTSSVFAMDQVNCDGTEERLQDCPHSTVCSNNSKYLDSSKSGRKGFDQKFSL